MSATVTAIGTTREKLDTFEMLRRWERFLKAKGHSQKTILGYKGRLVVFLATVLKPLDEVTEEDVLDYLDRLATRGSMRQLNIRALRSLYSWAAERGYVQQNPVHHLKARPPKFGPAPSLEPDEITRLVIAAAWREPRRAWTLILLYLTGARIGSMVAATADDVRNDRIIFRVTKGGKPYAVPLNAAARDAVSELAALRHPTLVGVGQERVRQWMRQAGLDCGFRAWPHLMRHSFATHLIERGADVRTVQELGNWSDLTMVTRYAAVSDPRKSAAVDLLA
jgi:site-specific recombinase XerD